MNTEKRIYQYEGLLTIKKSRVLKESSLPKEDIVPWLFLTVDKKGKRRYTFFIKSSSQQSLFITNRLISRCLSLWNR
jgi:hypothetical protein